MVWTKCSSRKKATCTGWPWSSTRQDTTGPFHSAPGPNLTSVSQVLTEKKPYFNCNDSNIVPKVQAGEIPERLPGRIGDSVWELLGKCWSRLPERRPSAAELHDAFSDLCAHPQATHTQGRLGKGELPEKLELWVQSIRFSLDKSKKGRFYVKLKYGNRDHTTPLTNPVEGSGEYTWFMLYLFHLCRHC